jgi:hypothetical protein
MQLEQLPMFEEDMSAQPPDPRLRWRCTRCGSEHVYGISGGLDAKGRYALAHRCLGCKRTLVTVERELTSQEKQSLPCDDCHRTDGTHDPEVEH